MLRGTADTAESSSTQQRADRGLGGTQAAVAGGEATKLRLVVTGFGRFHGVDDNPTAKLARVLEEQHASGSAADWAPPAESEFHVLEVSADGATAALEAIHARAGPRCVVLHMGVDTSALCFKLESRAYNEADFRCADERGFQPTKAPIARERDVAHALHTRIDVDRLSRDLSSSGWAVERSDDAGRFVCNYTYFTSMQLATRRPEPPLVLFLHVPPETVVPLEAQRGFVAGLLARLTAPQGPPLAAVAHAEAPPAREEDPSLASILELGFDRESARRALEASGGNLETAVLLLLGDGSGRPLGATRRFKLVCVVRGDVQMSTGKIAAQCCHAALGAYRQLWSSEQTAVLDEWRSQGEPVVSLRAQDQAQMMELEALARASGLPTYLVADAGRTQVDPGTVTVLAVGPAVAEDVDQVTGKLPLL